jgi:hypothetical protein
MIFSGYPPRCHWLSGRSDEQPKPINLITHTKRGSACIALGLEQIRTHRRRHRKQLSYLLRISHGA